MVFLQCNVISSNVVLVGAYKSGTIQEDPVNSEVRTVVDRRQHDGWNTKTYENDLLILKLNKPSALPPIQFNKNDTIPIGFQNLTVIGLGATDPRADYESTGPGIDVWARDSNSSSRADDDDVLQEVEILSIPDDVCNGEDMFNGFINQTVMLCAGIVKGGKDACSGDSGGPIFQKSSDGSMLQVGIVSFGAGCARANRPGIYTRVSAFSEWIHEQICDLSSNPPSSCLGPTPAPSTSGERSAFLGSPAPTMRFSSASPTHLLTPVPSDGLSAMPSDTPSMTPSYSPSEATEGDKPSPTETNNRSPYRRNWHLLSRLEQP